MNAAVPRPSFLALLLALLALSVPATIAGCASGDDVPRPDGGTMRGDTGGGTTDAFVEECTRDADCDDGDLCTGTETCRDRVCVPGTAVDCSDGATCTTDACDPATAACSHTPDDGACSTGLVCDPVDDCIAPRPCLTDDDCDDMVFCNGTETCDPAFGCRRGTAETCDDGFACTSDACDATTDACTNVPDAAVCDDDLPCNGAEVCDPTSASADGQGCLIGAAPVCDDGVACTIDGCVDAMGGCVAMPDDAACSDGTFCNGAERCDVTAGCMAGAPPACDDGVGCTTGACDPTTDACVQTGNDASCQDGMVCNGSERCDVTGATLGTGCVAGAPRDCSDGMACTTDSCTEPGTCVHGGSDADRDGYTAVGCSTGNDCDDLVPSVHPGATEICDGVDNDCSGTVDDGSGMQCGLGSAPRACTTTCGSPGTQACNATCRLGACVGSTELCNDCDDDSNGLIDDGLTCRRGTMSACVNACGTPGMRRCADDCSGYGPCIAAAETCNDCDDDGDGTIDDGLACRRGTSMACTTACMTAGTRVCAVDCSGYGACRAPAEICNGCDDDGIGGPDQTFACVGGSSRSCTTTCGTAGTQACNGTCSGYATCTAGEVCNGCDDDGDGTADDGFTCAAGTSRSCTTACGGTGMQTCTAGCAWGACAAVESCNGCDDDGDGTADEDFACRQGATMGCTTSCMTAGTRTCSATCSGFGTCSATEVCNGCDDDGVGGPDQTFACVGGSSRSCTTACMTTGTQACNGTCSGYGTCSATEVCNGCDDDGVGGADQTFACVGGSSRSCTTACMSPGTQACNGTCSGYATCNGAEVCNNCDDDGDGATDETFTCRQGATQACTTACGTAGSQTCNGTCSAFSTCLAPAEICGNGCDDNGTGGIDEGCGPPNDQCSGAIALAGVGSRTDTLVGATAQTSDCGSGTEVFYAVSVATPSIVYLSTVGGASFDTRISYRGTTCAGASAQCVDDSCGSLQTHLAQRVAAGTHYFAVHTFTSTTTPGAFTLSWRIQATTAGPAVHVPDDDLAAPGTVQPYSGATSGTGTYTPTACGLAAAGASAENLYYWAQCPADSRSYSATTCSLATWDTTLWFRFNGAQVGCNDDVCGVQSTASGPATGAGIVELFVDGYSTATGTYTVNLTL